VVRRPAPPAPFDAPPVNDSCGTAEVHIVDFSFDAFIYGTWTFWYYGNTIVPTTKTLTLDPGAGTCAYSVAIGKNCGSLTIVASGTLAGAPAVFPVTTDLSNENIYIRFTGSGSPVTVAVTCV
jgi:hypothetical protein